MKQAGLLFAAMLMIPGAAMAQGTAVVAPAVAPTQELTGTYRMVAGAVETRITPGRPYSAETVTELTQTLSDGNRISRTSRVKTYRDSEGRTRREMFDNEGKLVSIAISDPVAKVSYTLDPDKKVAFRMPPVVTRLMRSVSPDGPRPATGGGGGVGGVVTARPSVVEGQPAVAAGGGGRGGTFMRTPAPDNPNVKKEDLGTQNVEGVMAAGTRTTTTIPAGQIGNVQDIKVVSEQWFSDELQLLVMTRHSDPRTGENIYRVRNILRAEPDPSLFMVPPDYTVQDRGIRQ